MEAPQVPSDDALRTEVRLFTRWVDEDNQRVLNNAVYLTLLEEARLRYFSELSLMEPDGGFPFVLAQTNARFAAPGRGGREVSVRLGTTHLGNSSFVQSYRVRDADSGELWLEAEALLVAWDPKTRGKRPMSDAFRAAVARLEGLA